MLPREEGEVPFSAPRSRHDLEPAWLTGVLEPGGWLDGATVVDADVADLGVGRGFVSQTVRITPRYDGPAPRAPRSMVAKLPTFMSYPDFLEPLLGVIIKAEISWYNEAASDCAARVPECYWAGHESDAAYALLLEDLGGLKSLDQADSCTPSQARLVVEHLARAHAGWWESDLLRSYDWLPSTERQVELHTPLVQGAWDLFAERVVPEVCPDFLPVGERLARDYAELYPRGAASAATLVHGDFRSENLLFGDPDSREALVVLDWQLIGYGSGARDLAYFVGQSLDVPTRRAIETELLEIYYRGLIRGGVSSYSFDQLRDDYRLGLLTGMMIPINGVRALDEIEPPPEDASPEDRADHAELVRAGGELIALIAERSVSALMDAAAGDLLAD